ncbi:MAG: response regulator [Spirochaetes bacterium]|nr:response regulator [Spirochaetota bacterium]
MDYSFEHTVDLHELIDNLPDLILSVDYPSGIIQYANIHAIERLGLSLKKVKTLRDLSHYLHPRYRRKYLQHWRDIKDGILVPSFTFEVKTNDNTVLWVEQKNIYIKQGEQVIRVYAVIRDITERKRLEEEMLQAFYFSENLFLHSPYIILLYDTLGYIKRQNMTFRAIAEHVDNLIPHYNVWKDKQLQKHGIDLIFKEVLRGRIMDVPRFPYTLKIKGEDVTFYFAGKAFPYVRSSRETEGFVVMLEDVSAKHKREQETLETKRLESVGRLARGIAHEFNNILAGISGFAEILLRKLSPDDPNRHFATRIFEAASKAATLTNQLLGFARGQLYNPSYLDIRAPIMYAIGATPNLHNRINIKKEFEESEYKVYGDVNQLRQVFIEILRNAAEAIGQEGQIEIKVQYISNEFLPVEVRKKYAKCVQIDITDSGVGIDSGILSRVFEPYFTTKDPLKHSGMGLAIAFGHIKNHEGHITITPVEKGTKVTVLLPAIKEPDLSILKHPRYQRILVIDDNNETCLLLRSYFEDRGVFVTVSNNGLSAIEMIQNAPNRFDYIFLDLILPDISGKEVLTRIRNFNATVPVCVMSGHDMSSFISEHSNDSSLFFLMKPFNLEDLDVLLQ